MRLVLRRSARGGLRGCLWGAATGAVYMFLIMLLDPNVGFFGPNRAFAFLGLVVGFPAGLVLGLVLGASIGLLNLGTKGAIMLGASFGALTTAWIWLRPEATPYARASSLGLVVVGAFAGWLVARAKE